MPDRLIIEVSRDGWTNGLQLGISQLDENNTGDGYRLAGPKFNGSSKSLLKRELDDRDVKEIRSYLHAVFPTEDPAAALRARITAIHREVDGSQHDNGSCVEDGQDYPCATLRALDTEAGA